MLTSLALCQNFKFRPVTNFTRDPKGPVERDKPNIRVEVKLYFNDINNMRYLGILIETKLLKMRSTRLEFRVEVRPWSYHTVDSVYSLRGKAGNHFQLLVIELLSGSRGLVVLSPAWKTTRSEFDSQ